MHSAVHAASDKGHSKERVSSGACSKQTHAKGETVSKYKMDCISQKQAIEYLSSSETVYLCWFRCNAPELRMRLIEASNRNPGLFESTVSSGVKRHGVKKSYGVRFAYTVDGEEHESRLDVSGTKFYEITLCGYRIVIAETGFCSFAYAII